MASYTYLDFKNAVNDGIHGKLNASSDPRAFLNRAVNKVNGLIDFRSTIRLGSLSPGVYGGVFSYPAPTDLKDDCVIDIIKQANRTEEFDQTTPEQFDRTKESYKSGISIVEQDGIKYLRIATALDTDEKVINECDSLTANGTWAATGDASGLSLDSNDFINGTGSIKYNTASGGTTATITNPSMTAVDLTDYNGREIFVWQYIPATTNLTSFAIRWGSGASDYWTVTVTTTHEGLAFKVGWNLLKFSWPTTSTGTPVITAVNYFQLIINKSAGMAAATGWRTDYVIARAGTPYDIRYYSEYFWKTTAGVYIAKSTVDTDVLVAGDDEFELMVQCAMDMAGSTTRLEVLERQENKKSFDTNSELYRVLKPSERKLVSTTYYNHLSVDGMDDVTNINNLND